MIHRCHWPGCRLEVPPRMWGCREHWYRLPKALRSAIWRAYRPGQEHDKRPSAAYIEAAREAEEWARRDEAARAHQAEVELEQRNDTPAARWLAFAQRAGRFELVDAPAARERVYCAAFGERRVLRYLRWHRTEPDDELVVEDLVMLVDGDGGVLDQQEVR